MFFRTRPRTIEEQLQENLETYRQQRLHTTHNLCYQMHKLAELDEHIARCRQELDIAEEQTVHFLHAIAK